MADKGVKTFMILKNRFCLAVWWVWSRNGLCAFICLQSQVFDFRQQLEELVSENDRWEKREHCNLYTIYSTAQ